MLKLRTSAVAIAAVLILTHVAVLLFRYGTDTASLWGDWIDAIAPLVASVVCWAASTRAGPFGRRVWRLVCFLSPARRDRAGSLHLRLRLRARAARHLVAERCPGFFLGCSRGDDDLPESSRPRQRISMVASLRFCPSLHAWRWRLRCRRSTSPRGGRPRATRCRFAPCTPASASSA